LKTAGRIGKRFALTFTDKEVLAATVAKMLPGTARADWATVVRSQADTNAVLKTMDDVVAHNKAAATGTAKSVVDPATEQTVKLTKEFMESAKKKASSRFQASMDLLEEQGAFRDTRVNMTDEFQIFQQRLKTDGLVDEAGTFLSPRQALKNEAVEAILDPKSRRAVADIYTNLKKAADKGDSLPFDEAKRALDNIDVVLERSGFFKGGDIAINSQTRRQLKMLRRSIHDRMSESLGQKIISKDGQRILASAEWNKARHQYSTFRDVYDDFAMKSTFGGNERQLVSTVERMLGPKGEFLEQNFGKLAQATGQDGQKILARLQQLRAGRNLSEVYTPARTGFVGVTTDILTGGPRGQARFIGQEVRPLTEVGRKTPVSNTVLTGLKAKGSMTNIVRNLSREDRLRLIKNPELLRQLFQTINQAPAGQLDLTNQLLQLKEP